MNSAGWEWLDDEREILDNEPMTELDKAWLASINVSDMDYMEFIETEIKG